MLKQPLCYSPLLVPVRPGRRSRSGDGVGGRHPGSGSLGDGRLVASPGERSDPEGGAVLRRRPRVRQLTGRRGSSQVAGDVGDGSRRDDGVDPGR